MKKAVLLLSAIVFSFSLFAQQQTAAPQQNSDDVIKFIVGWIQKNTTT